MLDALVQRGIIEGAAVGDLGVVVRNAAMRTAEHVLVKANAEPEAFEWRLKDFRNKRGARGIDLQMCGACKLERSITEFGIRVWSQST